MVDLDAMRRAIRRATLADEGTLVRELIGRTGFSEADRAAVSEEARDLVERVRSSTRLGLMESFLAEYGLATDEGVALMSLAEALLRVPDERTVDLLIHDKVGSSDWTAHFGESKSPLVNFSSWALGLTADVLGEPAVEPRNALYAAVKRLGEPVIRAAVSQAMRMLGGQFVFGRTIDEAIGHAREPESRGYRFSYDMLGEAARTAADARRYFDSYADAIARLAPHCRSESVRDNPGISVKLSALHPRYELFKRDRVLKELVGRTLRLAVAARNANMGFNIDAEEADRLDLSLDVIAAVLADPALDGWDGLGVVVQAYGKRALPLIDWLGALARTHDRRIMVRLVKGAYWDAEIKRAQAMGLAGFPVFTRKAATDVSYIAAAQALIAEDRIYPQFATHNAHTAMAVLHLARAAGWSHETFEFQRLHGMGEALHAALRERHETRTRIYAPVGAHKDLLAYLVRRLLENGANGSFVYQIADEHIPAATVAEDPIARMLALGDRAANPAIRQPRALFAPERENSAGLDFGEPDSVAEVLAERERFRHHQWAAGPLTTRLASGAEAEPVINPADSEDVVGSCVSASPADLEAAIGAASNAAPAWAARPAIERADFLRRVADLYQASRAELFALLAREAGKTLVDAVSEVREAVDFLRYYAARATDVGTPLGAVTCISPWNFPLAIFTGQIAAALAAGNAVLAKPAPQTPLVAWRAVQLMHEAGIPREAIQLLPGGATVGAALTTDPRVAGVVFTGSLRTAKQIDRTMADHLAPEAVLIAETGGINAMVLDSTALPEQAVRDIVASAFQSAGQRCSALRILYVQEEAASRTIEMLTGAMDELQMGNPWALATDVGPVIDVAARDKIEAYVEEFAERGAVIKRLTRPAPGTFVGPAVLRVSGIEDLPEEIFGPVLHVATFRSDELGAVIDAINASGYGLTFGLHTRISSRVAGIAAGIRVGNLYVNRNQIGAVVGSQPFGGEGLSGTGPKAGGPHYLPRLRRGLQPEVGKSISLPGPTGESNTLGLYPRGIVLCLGPTVADRAMQIELAEAAGNATLVSDDLSADADAAMYFGADMGAVRKALSCREGAIIPLIASPADASRLLVERHVCIDTTAAGGNASLMSAAQED